MNPILVRAVLVFGLSATLAVFLGYFVAVGSYDLLIVLFYVAVGVFVVVAPGYAPLIALGLTCPFSTPIPYINAFPFLAVIMGLCMLKYTIRRWIIHSEPPGAKAPVPFEFVLFFTWVLIRYCIDPVIPNLVGFGESVTGFRSYLSYILCFLLLFFLRATLRTRDDIIRLIRWLGVFSLLFVCLLVPLIFTKSAALAESFTIHGLFTGAFDNGWLRFVILPDYGFTLVVIGLLPSLTRLSPSQRRLSVVIGMMAIVMGGNRSSFLMAFAVFLTIAAIRRRVLAVLAVAASIVACLALFRFVGEHYEFQEGVGFFRILSLTSQRVAEQSGADATVAWRRQRWERAMHDVRQRPFIGSGYGGLERAFVFGTYAELEYARIEIDVASGSIHNGFLSVARALGVPAMLLFIALYLRQVFTNASRAFRYRFIDPQFSDLHCFVLANLTALVIGIYIGAELNRPVIWFCLILGVLIGGASQKRASEARVRGSTESTTPFLPRPAAV